ncbi:MAG: hypothetical protein MR051_03700 [Lentisphaeria bacterium]|nr:hypothetical protein [Lentisphaeria bacterium]
MTARVAGAPFPGVTYGDTVLPSADGLIPGGSGSAVVLAPPVYNSESGEWLPAIVELGPWVPPYRGSFHVRCVSPEHGTFRIEDGADPSSPVCGRVNFPTLSNIPRTDVTVRFGGAVRLHLFLVISWARDAAGNPVYSAAFQTTTGSIPSGDCFAFEVAQIYPSGKVIQVPYYATIDLPGWVL